MITAGSNNQFEIRAFEKGIFRVRFSLDGIFGETLLSRYNIIKEPQEDKGVEFNNNTLSQGNVQLAVFEDAIKVIGAKEEFQINFEQLGNVYNDKGYNIKVSLKESERLFGLGDVRRDTINRRGNKIKLQLENVSGYGPMPFIMSSNGWGLMVNTTYTTIFDCGNTKTDELKIHTRKGLIDIYLYLPESHKLTDILTLQGQLLGNPILLPKFAYGMTYVLNEDIRTRDVLNECLNFRKEDICCDTIHLEPVWMDTYYDLSTEKKWNQDHFPLPSWVRDDYSGPNSFFYTLREMGFKFSLWLCNEYDLLWEEERQAGNNNKLEEKQSGFEGADIEDYHLSDPRYADQITKIDEPWFEHLKKFCDNGAEAFKLDAAHQINEHPDKLWACKYFDDEVHNVYPVLYVKQMQEGFTNHTGRRAFIFTSCTYLGSQRYAASWAGDTGGGFNTVGFMLNFGFSGHSNVTCDMDVTKIEGVHYGFLLPWTEMFSWCNWNYPWFVKDEIGDAIKYYSHLRSQLFPYIYSMSHKASECALPVVRALSLMYPDKVDYDNVFNTYLFGDSMLVGVFDMNLTLPAGRWIDFFTGDVYDGDQKINYKIPQGRGGALMIKEGSIFCTMDYQKYLTKVIPDNYHINIFPGADAEFTLYEDDGYTYDYKSGGQATTHMSIENSSNNSFEFKLDQRIGSFTGRTKDRTSLPSDPDIPSTNEVTNFDVTIFGIAKTITLNGELVDFRVDGKQTMFDIPREIHKNSDLIYKVEF